MLLLKIIVLQAFWLCVHLWSNYENGWLFFLASILLLIPNKIFYPQVVETRLYWITPFVFAVFGAMHDNLLVLVSGASVSGGYHLGLVSLWVVFFGYYDLNTLFKISRIAKKWQFLLAAIGAPLSYLGTYRFGIFDEIANIGVFFTFVAIGWGLFFVLSLKYVYPNKSGLRK